MKKFVLITVLVGLYVPSMAQEKLTDIRAPTSPASALLGVQPQSVLAPKSYRALETALYSNFLNSTGETVLPNDFGLEFTPYWASDHNLTIEEYLYPQDILKDQVIRNSSFSLASTQNYLLGDSTATSGLSFGYRTTLYFGSNRDREVVRQYKQQISENQRIQARIGAKAQELVFRPEIQNRQEFIEAIRPTMIKAIYDIYTKDSAAEAEAQVEIILSESNSLPAYESSDPDPFLDAFMNMVDANLQDIESELNAQQVFDQFKTYLKNRQGFSIDVAYGFFLNFPGNSFGSAIAPRHAIWITPTYRFRDELSRLQVMGVLRFEGYDTGYYKEYFPDSQVFENNIDYGIALAGDFNQFSVQFEAVGRSSNSLVPAGFDQGGNELFRKDSRSDFQAIGTFVYRLSDQLALTYSLGDSFEPIFNSDNTLVSLLSLNLGFGSPTREDLNE